MAEEAAAHHLLNVLEERELHVDLDRVLAAFEDESTKKEAAAWVNEYLNESTLLSKEEVEFYKQLKKKGSLAQYENDADDEPIRPLLDADISAAVDSLRNSTSAIEEQCRVLEAQRDALLALKALDKPNLTAEHARNERRRKGNQEQGRLDLAVEDLTTTINDQLSDLQRDVDADKSALKIYLTERLASDDKILTALPGIVSKIVAEPEAGHDAKSVENWCDAIVSFRTEEIKAKVDTVYLNSLSMPLSRDIAELPEEELCQRKEELQAELETLHSEIASVAEMVVEHELRKPLRDARERQEKDRIQARSAWLQYVLSTLDFMGKRLDTMTSHTSDMDGYRRAIAHVDSAAQRVAGADKKAPSPSRRRATLGPKGPFPPVKLRPNKSMDLPAALHDALRHSGMSVNHESMEALQDAISQMQLERAGKLDEHYASASASMHNALAERFALADKDARAIHETLYAHTPFANVSLTDAKVSEQLRKMERDVAEADRDLVDVETNELSLDDPSVRAFISRYGK